MFLWVSTELRGHRNQLMACRNHKNTFKIVLVKKVWIDFTSATFWCRGAETSPMSGCIDDPFPLWCLGGAQELKTTRDGLVAATKTKRCFHFWWLFRKNQTMVIGKKTWRKSWMQSPTKKVIASECHDWNLQGWEVSGPDENSPKPHPSSLLACWSGALRWFTSNFAQRWQNWRAIRKACFENPLFESRHNLNGLSEKKKINV